MATVGTVSPDDLERYSAFGTGSPILFRLPGAVPTDDHVLDGAPSLDDDASVIVVDATTGERIPHWVESDFLSPSADPPVFVIRPAIPLPRGTEVVVGVRGLTDASGTVVAATEPFTALRDAQASQWLGVHARRDHFESTVFPALEAQGWSRDSLQLAWSFPVRSADTATARMVAVRDAVFEALPADGPDYRIDSVLNCPGELDDPVECTPEIRVVVDGVAFVPSAMGPPNELGVRQIRLGPQGETVVEGVEEWPFRLQIPHIAFDGADPVPVLQYGHGFLGAGDEASGGWVRRMAERQGVAVLSCDMQGMNEADVVTWLDVLLNDGGQFPTLQELAMQGVTNQLVQQRMVRTTLATDSTPELYRDDGRLAWDPTTTWYHGNSQGGSVGTVMMAMSTDVTRGDLGVPGSGYPFLLHRLSVFEPFAALISATCPGADALPRLLAI